ncbi:transcriptional regulator [Sulfodiicoccus acidiphilus]|nr:MarR family transcriptional regulator [Sulfodiicoccus acidiphilus]GGU01183.1 transcriptional regulator [Sulfodiicoccus acidiphilus]
MDKVRLQDGREVDVYRLAGFLYGLSASDVELLKVILEQREVTTEYLAERLKVTKASVSKGLNNILDRGLISRDRAMRNGGKGRPIYIYKADRKQFLARFADDLQSISDQVRKSLEEKDGKKLVTVPN